MAETSAGGWVRRALRSSARTRPAASSSGTSSAGKGVACANTRSSASATEINATALLPNAKMTAAAAALFHEPDALDAHAAVDCLHHVIDGEAGDRNGGQRFHFDTGLAGHFYARRDANAGQLGIGRDVDVDLRQQQGMTQRDPFMGALGRHDAGDAL